MELTAKLEDEKIFRTCREDVDRMLSEEDHLDSLPDRKENVDADNWTEAELVICRYLLASRVPISWDSPEVGIQLFISQIPPC